MTPIVPRIAVFCSQPINTCIKTNEEGRWAADKFEVHCYYTDTDPSFLSNARFNVVVTIGNKTLWRNANQTTLPLLHLDTPEEFTGARVYDFYINTLEEYNPVVSIFSPAHNTFEKFDRCYNGVINQSYQNWEWIILDDSPDYENYNYINSKIGSEPRIKLYKSNRKDGFVGSTKKQAASLCNGKYLLELDHDDELHHQALDYIVAAFNKYPDAGFCYTDSAEVFETGGSVYYGEGFAMGHGKHYKFWYKGMEMWGSSTPINASTVRHIVGVPNHIRCWERDAYFNIGRHNNKLAVVDDYELLIRTFLYTKMIHIPEVLYVQYMNAGGNNTQEPRRAEIQRLVNRIQVKYDKQIHDRILELGGVDWLWNDYTKQSNIWAPVPVIDNRTTLAYVFKL